MPTTKWTYIIQCAVEGIPETAGSPQNVWQELSKVYIKQLLFEIFFIKRECNPGVYLQKNLQKYLPIFHLQMRKTCVYVPIPGPISRAGNVTTKRLNHRLVNVQSDVSLHDCNCAHPSIPRTLSMGELSVHTFQASSFSARVGKRTRAVTKFV